MLCCNFRTNLLALGSGLGIRVLGETSEEKLEIVRELIGILCEGIVSLVLECDSSQRLHGAPDIRSVGVMGDARKYEYTIVIGEVSSIDGMGSDWVRISWDVIENNSSREWSEAF